jgi:hypothetical protein
VVIKINGLDPEPTFGRIEIPHPPSDGTATLSAGLFKADQALVALGTDDIVF